MCERFPLLQDSQVIEKVYLVYRKDEADKVIAELKAENRRLKRALYKACANWMANRQVAMACYHLEARAKKFDKAIDKCRSMAERYK